MIIAFLFAVIINFGSYWYSDKIVLKMYGAKEVTPAESPNLHRIVDGLAMKAGVPKPKVYIVESAMPNAFATGRDPKHAAVAVTTGILNLLSHEEIEGVLAHELAHVMNRDTLISAVAATLAGVVTMLATMAQWAAIFGGFGSRDDDNGGIIGLIAMAIVAPIAATLIQLAISRSREYAADSEGAAFVENRGLLLMPCRNSNTGTPTTNQASQMCRQRKAVHTCLLSIPSKEALFSRCSALTR